MTRDEAIDRAQCWFEANNFLAGRLRHVHYHWDLESGYQLSCHPYIKEFYFFPSPFGGHRRNVNYFEWEHGWLVVFDPADKVAECQDECATVWINEVSGAVRGRLPTPCPEQKPKVKPKKKSKREKSRIPKK